VSILAHDFGCGGYLLPTQMELLYGGCENRGHCSACRESPFSRCVDVRDLESAGITTPADLHALVPSVAVYSGGQGSIQASLRGVGNLAGNTYAEQAIAFSLDGAYIARGEAIGGNFFDLERVEVLKGPQGTLYGRNTNAGAINLITKKPEIGKLSIDVGVDVGNYDKYAFDGATNLPVSDNSALPAAHSPCGYFSDGYNGRMDGARRLVMEAKRI
jgi:iron complex outermembrane receptor protein